MRILTDNNKAINLRYETVGRQSPFYTTLKQRVDQYFTDRNISRHADMLTTFKVIFLLAAFFGCYALLISNRFSAGVTLLWGILCGIFSVLIAMNISHDAVHNALFQSKKLNRWFSYTFDLVGLSSYMWQVTHNVIHHPYTNISTIDPESNQAMPFVRFSSYFPKKKIHRYQHLYAPFIYLFFTINLIFIRDFQDFGLLPKRDRQKVLLHIPLYRYGFLFFSKIAYLTLFLFLPMALLDIPWWQILLGFLIVQAVMSIFELVTQLPLHVNEYTLSEDWDGNGVIHKTLDAQMLDSTSDYLPRSKLFGFIFGGVNTHVIHHFFPGICHVHYVELTRILADTAKEFGMPYRSVSWSEGMMSHFRQLKAMGVAPQLIQKQAYGLQ